VSDLEGLIYQRGGTNNILGSSPEISDDTIIKFHPNKQILPPKTRIYHKMMASQD
jgi:hypothetical protein